MGLGDRLAHSAAGVHRRPCLLYRRSRGALFLHGRELWFRISGFWIRIFAVSFGMGVVTGIIMPFQFGTNWSRLTDTAADVISPLLAYEDLMAFFLEASFLGVLLFGRDWCRVGRISSPRSWWRSARCCRRSGFWRRTVGCRRRRATRSSMAASCRPTGSPSSSIRRFPIAWHTTSRHFTSRPLSSCWVSAPICCAAAGRPRRRA